MISKQHYKTVVTDTNIKGAFNSEDGKYCIEIEPTGVRKTLHYFGVLEENSLLIGRHDINRVIKVLTALRDKSNEPA